MKAKKHMLKPVLFLAAATISTSCQDWLTVYPQTQVVEEEFWEDKSDLEGVRYAAYKEMCNSLEKLVLWGELRSDNHTLWPTELMTDGGAKNRARSFKNIIDGHLERDSTNTLFDWAGFYTTINYCNKVLHHGEEVLKKDKQFTSAEWRQMKAEIVGLRALNYFYLLRAYKDIPYTTTVVNNDNEVKTFAATNQLVVLDSLIADVERVKGQARNRFVTIKDTKGIITNAAIYALLSDMYLWRASLHQGRGLNTDEVFIAQENKTITHTVAGDYRLSVQYADEAMKNLNDQIAQQDVSFGMSGSQDMISFGLNNVNLYKNEFTAFSQGGDPELKAHKAVFLNGNSNESIFELQFTKSDNRANNTVNGLWGFGANHMFSSVSNQLNAIYADNTLARNCDSRTWLVSWNQIEGTTNQPAMQCNFKWIAVGPSMATATGTRTADKIKLDTKRLILDNKGNDYRNWIIYRLSDVMLQKAEALTCLGELENNNDYRTEAMRIVHALHRRSYCNDYTGGAQPSENVSDVTKDQWAVRTTNSDTNPGNLPKPNVVAEKNGINIYEIAVMNERQIELYAEGKRWFDLVRFAERHAGGQNGTRDEREYSPERPIGDGREGVDLMVSQFFTTLQGSEKNALKTQIKNRYGLYNLIYYMEIKASKGVLKQNPVWNKSTYEK